jgi:hypothetical protein
MLSEPLTALVLAVVTFSHDSLPSQRMRDTFVLRASHPTVASDACLSRIPLAKQWVASRLFGCNKYSRDFVSHCVHIGEMIARFVRNIDPYPLGAGVTAPSPGVRLVINRQKREGKAVSSEPDRATPPSKWLWTGCSTKVRRRRHEEPAHAGLCPPEADTGWSQNGNGSRPCVHDGTRLHSNGTRRKAPS